MKKAAMICLVVAVMAYAARSDALLHTTTMGPNADWVTSINGIWWYPHMPAMTNMTYAQQLAFIDNLNRTQYAGLSSWRMSDYMNPLEDIRAELLTQTGFAPQNYITPVISESWYGGTMRYYWEGRTQTLLNLGEDLRAAPTLHVEVAPFEPFYLHRDTDRFWASSSLSSPTLSAWVCAVPEPSTLLLLGVALAGLAAIRKRFN